MSTPTDPIQPATASIGEPDELQLTCSELGASILKLQVPRNDGYLDVVTGYPEPSDYINDPYYMGAMCGRFAGRIGNAGFALNGKRHSIETPGPGEHALHGGARGFNTRFWVHTPSQRANELVYSLQSPDGDQGFPGCLDVSVTYSIERNTCLVVGVEARCDRDTVVNLVNHAYFNLNEYRELIDNHSVSIMADTCTVLDSTGIPTGDIVDVADTRFDLRDSHSSRAGAERRLIGDAQFDQNFILNKATGAMGLAAFVAVSEHPICMAVHTTLPGLQFYTGDQLGGVFKPREGLCLEAQHFPDAPNQPTFPDTVLRAGSRYHSKTIYAFGEASAVRELPRLE